MAYLLSWTFILEWKKNNAINFNSSVSVFFFFLSLLYRVYLYMQTITEHINKQLLVWHDYNYLFIFLYKELIVTILDFDRTSL